MAEKVFKIIALAIAVILVALLVGLVIASAFNISIGYIFGLREIGIIEGLGLYVLFQVLFHKNEIE